MKDVVLWKKIRLFLLSSVVILFAIFVLFYEKRNIQGMWGDLAGLT